MSRALLLALPCLLTLAACDESPPPIDLREGTQLPAGLTPARLTFTDIWQIVSSGGPLVAGNSVEVGYDTDRLTACRDQPSGVFAHHVRPGESLNPPTPIASRARPA